MISFELSEEQELIRETLRDFAAAELREIARDCDEQSALPNELLQKGWELGLVSQAIPEELGGDGIPRSPLTNAIVAEELACGSASLAAALLAFLDAKPDVRANMFGRLERFLGRRK